MKEDTLRSKLVYSGRLLKLREVEVKLANGNTGKREICEHPGAVGIIAITPKKEIVLIRQYRKPAEKILLEIPAGLIEKGEKLQNAAKRELLEETGYLAGKLKKFSSVYMSPGYSTEVLHYFVATDLAKKEQCFEDDEDIEVKVTPLKKALAMIKNGQIVDNKTIAGVLIAQWMI